MAEYTELGPVPCDEDAAQIGRDGFEEKNRKETRRYREMLEKRFPPDQGFDLVWFQVRANAHDFGTYREVAVYYDVKGAEQAAFVEEHAPATWDDKAVLTFEPNWRETRKLLKAE